MLTDNEKMTLLMKDKIKKGAANIVIQEVIMAIFNSYDFTDTKTTITAYFEKGEMPIIHKYFNNEYNQALNTFFSLPEPERNKILDNYILKNITK